MWETKSSKNALYKESTGEKMGIIKAAKLAYDYLRYGEEGEEPEVNRAINEVNLDIQEGQFTSGSSPSSPYRK